MRQKMDRALRAKQFMPFAALKGYEAALRQKERVVHPPVLLGEDAQAELDRLLRQLRPGDRGDRRLLPGGGLSGADRAGIPD